MNWRFEGTAAEREELARLVAEVADIQRTLTENHGALRTADRAAHQMQIGAARVALDVAATLPPELDGFGIFVPHTRAQGIGRISTGLGCPHLETDPDFLGIMLAFQTPAGERMDFLGINHPGAPTDTVEEFIALLVATAEAAGAEIPYGDTGELDIGNLTASQAKLFHVLRQRLGLRRATTIYLHIARQTSRTARSSSAVQAYWTGVVEARGVHGKFSFVPLGPVSGHRALRPGARHLSKDWERRNAAADIGFSVVWIPFVDEASTPLQKNRDGWSEESAVSVGTLTFLRLEPASRDARLVALLAAEMAANPGNWLGPYPQTRFTAARQIAYAVSQAGRAALRAEQISEFFTSASFSLDLEAELLRRAADKQALGHHPVLAVPVA